MANARTRIFIALSLGAFFAACEGPQGTPGPACTVTTADGGGATTITCPGSAPVTIGGGGGGGTCTVERADGGGQQLRCGTTVTPLPGVCTLDPADGGSTLTCPGMAPVTITNGADGEPCTVTDEPDSGVKTVTCPGSPPVTIRNGTSGSSCTVADNGDGTSTVTCSDGTTATISATGTHLTRFEQTPGLVLTIVSVTGAAGATFAPGDRPQVRFTLEDDAGRPVPLEALDVARIWFAGPTTNYQHVIPGTATDRYLTDVLTTSVRNTDGSYTYTFSAPIPTNFGVPLYDSAAYTDGELTGPLTAGTYTVAMSVRKNFWIDGRAVRDVSAKTFDVLLGGATTLAPRAVVGDDNCNTCHDEIMAHGGGYRGTAMCVTCHTSGSEDATHTATIDFRVMIHKIHNGVHLPSVLGIGTDAMGDRTYAATGRPYSVAGNDYSRVVFPSMPGFQIAMPKNQGYSALTSLPASITPAGATAAITQQAANNLVRRGVSGCAECHGDPDGAGTLTAPAQGDTAFTNLTRRACGSCHDDLDYTRPYRQNGETMGANRPESSCTTCHPETGDNIAVRDAHINPWMDPAVNPDNVVTITGVTGAAAMSNFAVGDVPTVSFTIRNPAGTADVPITSYDSFSLGMTGPTSARQVVWPGSLMPAPFDFTGRLMAASTTNKANMSKVFPTGTAVSESLTVLFTSATAFTVTGRTSGALGSGTLLGAGTNIKTNGTGYATFTNFDFSSTAVAQNLAVAFTSPTAFTVTGSVSGAMGGGTLPNAINAMIRFRSTDGSVSFNVTAASDNSSAAPVSGATRAFAAGETVNITVFKGAAANPVLFAIVPGRTPMGANERFNYDFQAPAATYTTKIPMEITMERLGVGTGVAGQVLTAGNLPVWAGRQVLRERTALVASTATTLSSPIEHTLERFIYLTTVDAALASGDFIVIDAGTANEEYAAVSSITTATRRITLARGTRYTHAAGATVQEATLSYLQEGTNYTLNSTTGAITLVAASTNVFVLDYRTDGRFGWKRAPTDTTYWGTYYQPADGLEPTDQTWGEWRGLPYIDGTYTVSAWGYRNIEYARNGEHQVYRGATRPSNRDILFGAAPGALAPYSLVADATNACGVCHGDITFHGAGRRSGDACMVCHATPGAQLNYAVFLHEFHFEPFPVMPNGAGACTKCHGTSNVWNTPTSHAHPAQPVQTRRWGQACGGCHDANPGSLAHIEAMTPEEGGESCEVCHGTGGDYPVAVMHQAR